MASSSESAIQQVSKAAARDDLGKSALFNGKQWLSELLLNFFFDRLSCHSHRGTLPPLPDGKRDDSRRGWHQSKN